MSDQQQQVDTNAARQAAMSRVVTKETILDQIASAQAAKEPTEVKTEDKQGDKDVENKQSGGKKTAQERISELANKRREAEAKADAAEARSRELEERLKRLESAAPPIEPTDKPKRADFSSQEEYEEKLTDWKVDQRMAQREEQQRQAKLAAEAQKIDADYEKSIESAKSKYDDFVEVVSAATINVPDFIVMAIKENKYGGDITYYLSKHIDEAKDIFAMRPVKALEQIIDLGKELGKELSKEDDLEPDEKPLKTQEKKKVPAPINALKGQAATNPSAPKNFEDYRAKRRAEMKK